MHNTVAQNGKYQALLCVSWEQGLAAGKARAQWYPSIYQKLPLPCDQKQIGVFQSQASSTWAVCLQQWDGKGGSMKNKSLPWGLHGCPPVLASSGTSWGPLVGTTCWSLVDTMSPLQHMEWLLPLWDLQLCRTLAGGTRVLRSSGKAWQGHCSAGNKGCSSRLLSVQHMPSLQVTGNLSVFYRHICDWGCIWNIMCGGQQVNSVAKV